MIDVTLTTDTLLILAAVALIAGFIDAIAGGGGLITLPAMLLLQIPPIQALATNKLQGSFGTLMSSYTLMRKKVINFEAIKIPFLWVFAGSALGTLLVHIMNPDALRIIIPIVLIIIALYFLFAPQAGDEDRKPRLSQKPYRHFVLPSIGFYDGFLGPGTGSFFAMSEVMLRGHNLVKATANAKAFNFASNLASLIIFLFGGHILWLAGAVMIVGQLIGSYLGSLAIIGGGARLIRPVIVVVCLSMVIKFWFG